MEHTSPITEMFLKFALLGAEWVMYVLIACSIVTIGIIIERVLFLRSVKCNFPQFIQAFTTRLSSADPLEKTAQWAGKQKSIEARVAAVGLGQASQHNMRSMEESMQATMISLKIKLERGLTILATLGNNTPFLGLFGTILGVIQAFQDLKNAQNMGPEVVMGSISEALVATAIGLLVAIPAVIAFNLIGRSVKTQMANADTTARILMTHFAKSKNDSGGH